MRDDDKDSARHLKTFGGMKFQHMNSAVKKRFEYIFHEWSHRADRAIYGMLLQCAQPFLNLCIRS